MEEGGGLETGGTTGGREEFGGGEVVDINFVNR